MSQVMAAALIRVVFGMSASVTTTEHLKWIFFTLGFLCLCFEYFIISRIFQAGIAKFSAIETARNKIACQRIKILRVIFFSTWTAFPIIWVLAPTGLCLIGEDVTASMIPDTQFLVTFLHIFAALKPPSVLPSFPMPPSSKLQRLTVQI